VVCCHSLACVLWFREAARIAPDLRVDRVVLVAPPCPGSRIPELARFYPVHADRAGVHAAAGHTRLVCADDDPYCPAAAPTRSGRRRSTCPWTCSRAAGTSTRSGATGRGRPWPSGCSGGRAR
jgi:predicted alpha/beta hydrolase family esterase